MNTSIEKVITDTYCDDYCNLKVNLFYIFFAVVLLIKKAIFATITQNTSISWSESRIIFSVYFAGASIIFQGKCLDSFMNFHRKLTKIID